MGSPTTRTFSSWMKDLGPFKGDWPQSIVKNEIMFFNASPAFAWEQGGPITKAFVEALPEDWKHDAVLDSRVHMLMQGWYPCIPGFHHDDVPRPLVNGVESGQPDYEHPRYRSEHVMGLVNGDICPTLFAIGEATMPGIPEGEIIYKAWHPVVQSQLDAGILKPVTAPSGRIIYFSDDAFHTGQQANAGGWRWFCRVSRGTDRVQRITNEIRRQVQVYLEFPMEGW